MNVNLPKELFKIAKYAALGWGMAQGIEMVYEPYWDYWDIDDPLFR